MIKLEHVVLPSPEQMEFVIEGMRNPMNSWDKSDSYICPDGACLMEKCAKYIPFEDRNEDYIPCNCKGELIIGPNDLSLMQKLSNGGPVHSKFMRMMPVMVRITAPLYWWKEFDTYKVGTVANSCSTMHKIQEKEFTKEDFSHERLMIFHEEAPIVNTGCGDCGYSPDGVLELTIKSLNKARELYLKTKDKRYWWQMIQLLPTSYNQTRNVMLDYEVLKNIYIWRKDHKLDEWVEFCKWIETLPYHELITGDSQK